MKQLFLNSNRIQRVLAGNKKVMGCLAVALLVIVSGRGLQADGPPPLMSFQTRVLDESGDPVEGQREVIFRIYDFEAGGEILWAERQTVSVKQGYISVILGQGGFVDGEPGEPEVNLGDVFPGFADSERYIEVQVGETRISPRLRLLPTAYSFVSAVALRVVDGGIDSSMIRDGTITSANLGAGSVNMAALADNSVTTSKIVDGTIQTVDLANGSVTTPKIENGAVGTAKLADGSVSTAKLQNGSVNSDKLANNAVSTAKIGDGQVSNAKLANSSVTTDKLQNNAVTGAKIANNTVAATKLQSMFVFQTYTPSLGSSQFGNFNTSRSTSTWVPVLAGWNWGTVDIQENGTGEAGGVHFYESGGTWWYRVGLRTHNTFPNPRIQVVWIPRSLFSSVSP